MGVYAAVLALMAIALSMHVTILRAKTKISIYDGGNMELATRIRRHGNFAETIPMALLLLLIAELLGTKEIIIHICGNLLILGRIMHAFGLRSDVAATPLRIAGGMATTITTIIMVVNIIINSKIF